MECFFRPWRNVDVQQDAAEHFAPSGYSLMWLVGIGGESEDLKTARPGFVHLRTCNSSYFITLRFAICIGFCALFAKTSPEDADSSQPWSSICPGEVAPAACVSTIAAGGEHGCDLQHNTRAFAPEIAAGHGRRVMLDNKRRPASRQAFFPHYQSILGP
jgi:hypothetical protein